MAVLDPQAEDRALVIVAPQHRADVLEERALRFERREAGRSVHRGGNLEGEHPRGVVVQEHPRGLVLEPEGVELLERLGRGIIGKFVPNSTFLRPPPRRYPTSSGG